MEKKFFTCEEVAELYCVKVETVWAWIREKKLGSVKIGKLYRIRQQDLDAFEHKNDENS